MLQYSEFQQTLKKHDELTHEESYMQRVYILNRNILFRRHNEDYVCNDRSNVLEDKGIMLKNSMEIDISINALINLILLIDYGLTHFYILGMHCLSNTH